MKLNFFKYSATGNDFIVLDGRSSSEVLEVGEETWQKLCHRQNGIGADGVLIVSKSTEHAFKMKYINADGHEVAMCGNGARAICHYAHFVLQIPFNQEKGYHFETLNGVYTADINSNEICIKMSELYDEEAVKTNDLLVGVAEKTFYINTGVPHVIFLVSDLNTLDINEIAPAIRYDKRFVKGTNVNFLSPLGNNKFALRTYERGVEGVTLSCGTGTVACAIFAGKKLGLKNGGAFEQLGGTLKVAFNENYSYVTLSGPVNKVFEGTIEC